ncbi:MAG: type II toxin-antitoxin system VapB family antitoxin [Rhodospirillales bacterium]|nr:type II toxin-antitoxin system VapB family antitoxin [Rhodospirillales bacterium]
MRTTIDVNDALLKAVKTRAANEHRTLKETFEQALRAYLSGPPSARTDAPPIPTFRGHGVQLGVDLTDSAALQAIMDAEP